MPFFQYDIIVFETAALPADLCLDLCSVSSLSVITQLNKWNKDEGVKEIQF